VSASSLEKDLRTKYNGLKILMLQNKLVQGLLKGTLEKNIELVSLIDRVIDFMAG